jgi:D-alanyl-D-alanine carboxypeptidase
MSSLHRPNSCSALAAPLARLTILLLLAVLPVVRAASPAEHPEVRGATRLFEAWLEGQMAYRQLPGIAVGVVHDQQLVWARGFGFANVEQKLPVTPATKFRIASHSKLFTATAIMQLRDAGKLRLDDPVAQHLPWFTMQPVAPGDDAPPTLAELLTHHSGLPREATDHWSTFKFPDAAGLRTSVQGRPTIFAPEVRWKYSNLAYALAGQIVEKLSGDSYADYVQRRIFTPLGMKDSSVDHNVAGLAIGYGRRMPDGSREKMPFVDARALGAATGLTSTVEDLARFVSLQFRTGKIGGAQILSTGALREMHRVRVLESNWTQGYAIGFAVNRDKDRVFIGHGGSYPGYKTHTLIQLDDKVGVIVLTNGDDSVPADLAKELMATVGRAVAKAAAPADAKPEWDPKWSRFAGLYRNRNSDLNVVELDRRLVIINPGATSLESQVRLVPIGGDRFRYEAPTGGAAVGEVVRFAEENGRVIRMFTGDSFIDRVAP